MSARIIILFTILLSCLTLLNNADAKIVDRIVAKINGEIITLNELKAQVLNQAKLDNITSKKELARTFNKNKKDVLNKMIEEKLQLHYANEQNMKVSKDAIDMAIEEVKNNNNMSDDVLEMMIKREGLTVEEYREKLKHKMILTRLISSQVWSRVKVTEKEVLSYYKKNKKMFFSPEEIKVRHILFLHKDNMNKEEIKSQKKKALRVLDLANNAGNFESLAQKYSEGPSKKSGGDLGWVKKGTMLPAFEKAAFSLKKDALSNLVKTKYGYHIIKVEGRKKPSIKRLDAVRKEINQTLSKEKFSKSYERWIEEIKKNSFIEITLESNPAKKKFASLSGNKKRRNFSNKNQQAHRKGTLRTGTKKSKKINRAFKPVNLSDRRKISKFILKWEKTLETKNRRRYFSLYSKDFKPNGSNLKKWKKRIESEHKKYKFLKVEIRDLRVFKRDNYYVATFDQRLKSNIEDQIRLVRLHLKKGKGGFNIAQEKWLNSPYTSEEFSKKTLLTLDNLPKSPSASLSKKNKQRYVLQPTTGTLSYSSLIGKR